MNPTTWFSAIATGLIFIVKLVLESQLGSNYKIVKRDRRLRFGIEFGFFGFSLYLIAVVASRLSKSGLSIGYANLLNKWGIDEVLLTILFSFGFFLAIFSTIKCYKKSSPLANTERYLNDGKRIRIFYMYAIISCIIGLVIFAVGLRML